MFCFIQILLARDNNRTELEPNKPI